MTGDAQQTLLTHTARAEMRCAAHARLAAQLLVDVAVVHSHAEHLSVPGIGSE